MKKSWMSWFLISLALIITSASAVPQSEQEAPESGAESVPHVQAIAVPFAQQIAALGSEDQCATAALAYGLTCPAGTCRTDRDCPSDLCSFGAVSCDVNVPLFVPCLGACYCG